MADAAALAEGAGGAVPDAVAPMAVVAAEARAEPAPPVPVEPADPSPPAAPVARPPVLRWKRVRGARCYNVQLYRGTRKMLSACPSRPRLRPHRLWPLRRRASAARADYQWYVRPGYGRRAQRRYGLLLGTRRFAVVRRPAR